MQVFKSTRRIAAFLLGLGLLSFSCGEIRIAGVPLDEFAKGKRSAESTSEAPEDEAAASAPQRPQITLTALDIPKVVAQIAGPDNKTWVLQSRTEDGEPPDTICHADDQLVIFARKLIEIRVGNARCRMEDGSLDKDVSATWQLTDKRSLLIIGQDIPPYQVHIVELSPQQMLLEFTDSDGTLVQERYQAVIGANDGEAAPPSSGASGSTNAPPPEERPQPGSLPPDVPENIVPNSGGFGTRVPDVPIFGPTPKQDEDDS